MLNAAVTPLHPIVCDHSAKAGLLSHSHNCEPLLASQLASQPAR